jgi:hypothetical protein
VKHCSSCGRDIPELATVCDGCDRWAADPMVRESDATPKSIAEPSAPSVATTPLLSGRATRRELPVILLAAGACAIIMLGLFFTRGTPSSGVSAAAVEATTTKPSASPSPAPFVTPKWSSENSAYWVGNHRKSAALELRADNSVEIWQGRVRPSLIVRCLARNTQVFVFTGSAMKIERQTEAHTITFAFDNEPELTERWPDSDEHDALFAPDGAAFAQGLLKARTMRFGYTPHNALPVVAQFQVSGLGDLIGPIAKECGWKP